MTALGAPPAVVGTLDRGALARVNATGEVLLRHSSVDWWIGADDRWHFPAEDTAVRQSAAGVAPIIETAMRVPGGDAVHRVFAVGGPMSVVVVEVENQSPAPFSLAMIVRSLFPRVHTIEATAGVVRIARAPVMVLPRAPFHWATARVGHTVRPMITSGAAPSGAMVPVRGRGGIEAGFLLPVAHRTTRRIALVSAGRKTVSLDPDALPDAEAVTRGWEAHLERGMRTELPDPMQAHVDRARVALLIAGTQPRRDEADTVVALEDWGFDREAQAGWRRLGTRARRTAARRNPEPAAAWTRVRTYAAAAGANGAFPGGPQGLLAAMRDVLVTDRDTDVDVLPGFPPDWLGRSVAVHDAPLRAGRVSFALRWHGARPALLWEAPPGTRLHAPALDPTWTSIETSGEVLLAEPPSRLLAMGQPSHAGEPVEDPKSFQ